MDENLSPTGETPSGLKRDTSALVPMLGLVTLVFCGLTVYFLGAAESLAGNSYAPAHQALVTALRVLAGACAIPALVLGLSFLNRRDEAIMRAQRAADGARSSSPDDHAE